MQCLYTVDTHLIFCQYIVLNNKKKTIYIIKKKQLASLNMLTVSPVDEKNHPSPKLWVLGMTQYLLDCPDFYVQIDMLLKSINHLLEKNEWILM